MPKTSSPKYKSVVVVKKPKRIGLKKCSNQQITTIAAKSDAICSFSKKPVRTIPELSQADKDKIRRILQSIESRKKWLASMGYSWAADRVLASYQTEIDNVNNRHKMKYDYLS